MRVNFEYVDENLTRIKLMTNWISLTLATLVPVQPPSPPIAPVALALAAASTLAVSGASPFGSQLSFLLLQMR